MRTRGWKRQWEKLGLKVKLTDMKTAQVDLDIAKDGGQVSLTPKQGQRVRRVSDSSGEKHCQGHHNSVLQIATCTCTTLIVLHTFRQCTTHTHLQSSDRNTHYKSTFHKHQKHTYLTQTSMLHTKLAVCLNTACISWTLVTSSVLCW